ncbi:MAG: flavodoxin domain-containing protein [Lentimicrobium sp.]|jgi:menaquinone-dependent protoporphyrinogen oxidase|nr:flavodoxin domain-containing protein [Lentimicrobium sp.]MDD2527016.1 flavodoxin domain-containing protein [Lentimicrobiaceae bacterium]MDD4598539.1 flavodoxin domain-containing protein [Lentimicrobiaceae bacterium]MDY0027066.1 flavodoxin domain-containing protein [Lentimicrobium sp.]
MKTVILYVCKHGVAGKIAQLIRDSFPVGEITIIDLKKVDDFNIEHFDIVILGTSTNSGKINRKMHSFISKNAWTLLRKQLGLYLYCKDKTNATRLLDHAYPYELKLHSKSCRAICDEVNYKRVGFIERTIVRRISNRFKFEIQPDGYQLNAFIKEMTE